MTMNEPRLHHVPVLRGRAVQRMAYREWGDAANPRVLVCVHGLSRQGLDFDVFARAMADQYRVVAPDVFGRGDSDWLPDAMGYQVPLYAADMVALIARLGVDTVHWVGTSMGGLIGMVVAALGNSPITRLVLNDVGPQIEADAVTRIGTYLGQPAHWATEQQAADALWAISRGFGPHTPEQWLALSRPMLRPDGDGFKLHYDPSIAQAFRQLTPENAKAGEAVMWAMYDHIRARTLVLRGADSDLLSPAGAAAMAARGPKAALHEFPGVGHAPMLTSDDQIGVVRTFLLSA
jgi:pimeloyl-ACP methyl ester carboxylesterase